MTDDDYTVVETVLLNHVELTTDENAELVAALLQEAAKHDPAATARLRAELK